MGKFGTPEAIGEANRKLILDRLRVHGDMSKADLSRSIGLSFTAIASNVRHLLEHGYVREMGTGDNAYGRKSMLLSFNARRGYVVGVDIGRSEIRCMLADLLGNQIACATGRTGGSGDRVIDNVVAAIGKTLLESGVASERVLCACVGIPGVLRGGKVYLAPKFPAFSIDALRESLAREYGVEALVENGVNLGAIGEHRYGGGARYADMVYISYGVGLGAALVLDGRLHTGRDNAAGEIGFMQTRPDSPRTRFRQTGDLESALSLGASPPRGRPEGKRAGAAFEDAALNLGMALVNICAVLNPQAVILSGGMGKTLGGAHLPRWRGQLCAHLPFPPELLLSELDERETMLGAVGTAVDYVATMPIAGS